MELYKVGVRSKIKGEDEEDTEVMNVVAQTGDEAVEAAISKERTDLEEYIIANTPEKSLNANEEIEYVKLTHLELVCDVDVVSPNILMR